MTASREFRTTHWSVVLAAGHESSAGAAEAMERLCQSYWYPLYHYLRRTGLSPHDAQDLTQGFLASLIQKRELADIVPERGRFRSFLLGTLKHYLSDERKKTRALKRGGGQIPVSLDEAMAEARYQIEPADNTTPETQFERQWGKLVLERVLERLRRRYEERGKGRHFAALQPCLGGSAHPASHATIAAGLGLSDGAVKVAIHRFRREFGQILRDEIAQTVAGESEIDEEIRHLIRVTG